MGGFVNQLIKKFWPYLIDEFSYKKSYHLTSNKFGVRLGFTFFPGNNVPVICHLGIRDIDFSLC